MVFKNQIDSNAQKAENVLSSFLQMADNKKSLENSKKRIAKCKANSVFYLFFSIFVGIILLVLGILTIFYPLYDLILLDHIRFHPGFPSFQMWLNNDVIIRCKIHLFNFTNVDEFVKGIDKKLKIKDIGEIVFHEHQIITNVTINSENSTLSYNVNRIPEFVSEWNRPGILNETITVPNIPLLLMASFIYDSNAFTKIGFNLMSKKDPLFVNITIYNYLYNFTTPALNIADRYFSFLLPSNNVGMVIAAYETVRGGDHFNVNIGMDKGPKKFFRANTFNYRTTVSGFHLENGDCNASIINSTEGNLYGSLIQKDDVLWYWRKTVCRIVPLYFEKEVYEHSFLGYKFAANENMFDREQDLNNDCYASFDGRLYPDGLSDASKCFKGLPVALSLPHFYGRDGHWNNKIEGYEPSREKHNSFAIVEPTLGIPLHQRARAQCNLVLPPLYGFRNEMKIFKDMVIPLIWMEYSVENLTTPIFILMSIVIKFLPIGQYCITLFIIALGSYSIYLSLKTFYKNKKQYFEIKLINDNSNIYIDDSNKLDEINDICLDVDSDMEDDKSALNNIKNNL